MIKLITAAVVCVTTMIASAEAQALDDGIILQYGEFKKSKLAAKMCASEVDGMQAERNHHYENLLHTKAQNPDAPTIEEMSDVLAQTHAEDATLSQKRETCTLLLDQLIAAAIELRRNCELYSVSTYTDNEAATAADMLAENICHGSAKENAAEKPGN
jgi:hypothetical protein